MMQLTLAVYAICYDNRKKDAMIKPILKKTLFFFSMAILSILVLLAVVDLYEEWRFNLYDINGDGIFAGGIDYNLWGQSVWESRIYGIPYTLGLLLLTPFIGAAAFIVSLVLSLFEHKGGSLPVINRFGKKKFTTRKKVLIQIFLSLVLEVIAGIIIYAVFFNKIAPVSTFTLLQAKTPLQIILYSAICYIFSIVTVILAKHTLRYEGLIRIGWIILVVYFFLSMTIGDYIRADTDSFLFTLIPVSLLIPLCSVSVKKTGEKKLGSLIFFIYFFVLWILIYAFSCFHPFGNA